MVSVVVSVRDNIEELTRNLPLMLTQDYPSYEVVVVNDSGNDEMAATLEILSREYQHLRVTAVPHDTGGMPNRKLSLTVGIKAARGEWILLTESSCRPAGVHWVRSMARHFNAGRDVVIGYGGLRRGNTFASAYYRAAERWRAVSRLGFALAGGLFIGQRRNLGFRKECFFANRGYAGYNHLVGGEDDLFTLEIAKRGRTAIELSAASQTLGLAPSTWGEVNRERQIARACWARYPSSVRIKLRLEPTARLLIWLLALPLLGAGGWLALLGAGVVLLRRLLHLIAIMSASRRLIGGGAPIFAWLYDILSPWLALRPKPRERRGKIHRTWR